MSIELSGDQWSDMDLTGPSGAKTVSVHNATGAMGKLHANEVPPGASIRLDGLPDGTRMFNVDSHDPHAHGNLVTPKLTPAGGSPLYANGETHMGHIASAMEYGKAMGHPMQAIVSTSGLPISLADDGGWITLNGVHVHLGSDGNIDKGPASFVGKKPSEVGSATRGDAIKSQNDAEKSSLAAKGASDKANSSDSGSDHAAAAESHAKAAESNEQASKISAASGDKGRAAKHAGAASLHRQAVSRHSEAVAASAAASTPTQSTPSGKEESPKGPGIASRIGGAVRNAATAVSNSEVAGHIGKILRGFDADPVILDASTLPAANEIPGGLEGLPTFEEVDSEQVSETKTDGTPVFAKKKIPVAYYWKEAARTPGLDKLWTHRGATQASGEPFEFPLTAEDFEDTERNFRDRQAAGIRPFIPDSHVEHRDAAANNGEVIDVKRRYNNDGTHSLMTKLKVVGTRGQEKVLNNDVSVYLVNGNDKLVVDANGKRYKGRVLHHVALTPNPALPHLEPFKRIAASADAADMRDVPVYCYVDRLALAGVPMCNADEMAAAKEHLTSMGEDTSDLKPDNAVGKLIAHGKKMKDGADGMKNKHDAAKAVMALAVDAELEPAVKKLTTDLAAATTALATEKAKVVALSAGDPDALTPWNLSAFEMNADTLREACIKSGKISAADAKAYSSIFRDTKGKPTRIALAATCENGHPAELNFWRTTLGLADGIKTGNVVPRDATATSQAAQLALDAEREGTAQQEEKERPEIVARMRKDLHLSAK